MSRPAEAESGLKPGPPDWLVTTLPSTEATLWHDYAGEVRWGAVGVAHGRLPTHDSYYTARVLFGPGIRQGLLCRCRQRGVMWAEWRLLPWLNECLRDVLINKQMSIRKSPAPCQRRLVLFPKAPSHASIFVDVSSSGI